MTVFANLSMRRLKTNIRPYLTWQKLGWIFLAAGSQVEWLHTGDSGGVRLESEYQSSKEKHGSHWQLKRTLNRTSDSAKYLWIHPNWSQTWLYSTSKKKLPKRVICSGRSHFTVYHLIDYR